jgi:hypothetical protein
MTTFTIDVFMKRVLGEKYSPVLTFFLIAILALTTGAGYFVSQIKPDYLLPIILLGMYSIITKPGRINITDILLCLVILFGLLAHLSHLPVASGLFLATIILALINRNVRPLIDKRKYMLVFFFILSAWLIVPSVNYLLTGRFVYSRVSNIFATSRLIQAGAFQEYVQDRCQHDSVFYLCKYKGKLQDYTKYYHFLWEESSFLYDHPCRSKGKLQCWLERDMEFGILVEDIYSQRKYVKMLASDAIYASAMQLISFKIPDYHSFKEHEYPFQMAEKYLPSDNWFLQRARQNKSSLDFPLQNLIQFIVILLSAACIVYLISSKIRKHLNSRMVLLGSMILFLLIGNAVFVGTVAGFSDRFQGRIIWLVPLYAIVFFFIDNIKPSKAGKMANTADKHSP